MRRERSLTMVEMLVVMGICGVLALLLTPALLHARASAKSVACAGRLSALGQMYAVCLTENNGVLPCAYYSFTGSSETCQVALETAQTGQPDSLVTSDICDALICPADDRPAHVLGRTAVGNTAMVPCSYAYNVALPVMYKNVSRVASPVNTVTFYDGDASDVVGTWGYSVGWAESTVRPRHSNQVNYLYLDGHVLRSDAFPSAAFNAGTQVLTMIAVEESITSPGSSGTPEGNPNGTPEEQPSNTHQVTLLININPSNSVNNDFSMTLPDGFTITRSDLADGAPINHAGFNPSQLEYTGSAGAVMVRPKGNGDLNGLLVDGQPYPLSNGTRYTIGASSMSAHLYNDKYKHTSHGSQPMGKWWLEVTASTATITAN
jgi:prepilin-type processing-associated H-X9-DG protein